MIKHHYGNCLISSRFYSCFRLVCLRKSCKFISPLSILSSNKAANFENSERVTFFIIRNFITYFIITIELPKKNKNDREALQDFVLLTSFDLSCCSPHYLSSSCWTFIAVFSLFLLSHSLAILILYKKIFFY